MSDEPKKPATPVADAIDAAMPDTRPGHDVTDGATGKAYSQAGEKSAGQLLYEKDRASKEYLGATVPWDDLSKPVQRKWQFNATATPRNQTIKAP